MFSFLDVGQFVKGQRTFVQEATFWKCSDFNERKKGIPVAFLKEGLKLKNFVKVIV